MKHEFANVVVKGSTIPALPREKESVGRSGRPHIPEIIAGVVRHTVNSFMELNDPAELLSMHSARHVMPSDARVTFFRKRD